MKKNGGFDAGKRAGYLALVVRRELQFLKIARDCVFLPHLLANVKEKLYLCMQI